MTAEMLTHQAETPREVMKYIAEKALMHTLSHGWCDYIEPMEDGGLMIRTWTYKSTKKNGLQYKEVIRRIVGRTEYAARGLEYRHVYGWYTWYDDPEEAWNKYEDRQLRAEHPLINEEILRTLPEWKYCGTIQGNAWLYLTEYQKDHSVEYFGKMGMLPYKTVMSRAKKDGQFRRWLFENHQQLRYHCAQTILYAYDKKIGIRQAEDRLQNLNRLKFRLAQEWYGQKPPKGTWTNARIEKLLDYLQIGKQYGMFSPYNDYLHACMELHIDITESVLFPKDFQTAHDLRTRQLQAKREKLKEAEKKQFSDQCDKFRGFETKSATLMIVLPHDAEELVAEGEALNHCVGRMGYDRKVAEGISLIAFVRSTAEPDKPLYTIEYSLKNHKLVQEHGFSNAPLPAEASAFVKAWCDVLTAGLTAELKEAHA